MPESISILQYSADLDYSNVLNLLANSICISEEQKNLVPLPL